MLPDTNRDDHWHTAISLATPYAIRYAGVVLPRFTVRPDGRTPFQYLLGTPYVSPLCMFGESVFALIPDHEVRAAKLTNRWVSGCWWRRDASSDEHLVETKHGLLKCRSVRRKPLGEQWSRRETIEARGTKWNFDVEMDSGIPGPTLEPRRDEGMPTAAAPMEIPTVPPPAPPPEKHEFETQVHNNSGGGDVAAKTRMVICDPPYMNPAKTKVIGKVVRYTNTHETPIPELLNIDRYWPDHHYTEVTGTQERHQRNDGIVETTCHFRGQVHHYCEHHLGDSCNLPGIRVPKCTRWRPQ